jgi:hypothetical protein
MERSPGPHQPPLRLLLRLVLLLLGLRLLLVLEL